MHAEAGAPIEISSRKPGVTDEEKETNTNEFAQTEPIKKGRGAGGLSELD